MDLPLCLALLLVLAGTAAGSFLAVLADRQPRGEDWVRRPSACRACNAPLALRDLVPLASWLALGGRCRRCGAAIPAWLPAMELGGAAAALLAAVLWPAPLAALLGAGLLWCLLGLAAADALWLRLPDPLTAALGLFAFALAWLPGGPGPGPALAAGAAGAYAISRPDLSSSLPGVAIAVALVPPLGVVGMTLEAGRTDLARGALLLYVTNLIAMVGSGVLVFLLTGFAPPRRLATTSTRVLAGGLLTVVLMVVVAVPLTLASVNASADARDREDVESAVRAWISSTGDEVDEVDIDGSSVIVRVFGFDSPPPTGPLQQRVQQILGPDATVEVRWTQAQLAPTDTVEPTEEELLTAEVSEVARQWLEASEIGAYELRVTEVSNDFVLLDVTSAVALPAVEDLQARLRDATGLIPQVEVRWTEQTRLLPDDGTETIDETTARLERVARDWALEQPDLSIVRVGYDGVTVTVDLIGVTAPDGPALERLLLDELATEADVRIWFSERSQLVPVPTPTATPVPPPTPVPTPTPERQPPARATPAPGG